MRRFLSVILALVLTVAAAVSVVGCAKSNTFKVIFETEGGVRVSGGALIQEVESAEQITAPVLEKEGFTFVGWDKIISGLKSDSVVKAVWEKNKFTVTFSVAEGTHQEGSGATIQTVAKGSDLILPVFVREGYTLSWDKDISEIDSTCTVNGIWTAKEYKVSFRNSDGSEIPDVEDIKIKYDEKVPALPTLPNGEKKFVGWKTTAGVPLTQGQVYKTDSNLTVRAVWTDFSKYVLSFDLDGGNQMNLPTTYTEGTGAIINAATRDGFSFKGWVEVDKNGQPISEPQMSINIGKTETGDKYFKATWEIKKYTVYFKTISGEVSIDTMTFSYGQTITELPTVTGNDGIFVCWRYNGNEIKVGEKWLIDESGIDVNAEFIRKFVFTLTLSRKVGNTTQTCTLPSGTSTTIELNEHSTVILPTATPVDAQEYRFSCWKYKDDNGKWVKLASNTLINQNTFPDLDFGNEITVNIELVAFCSSNWTGYY